VKVHVKVREGEKDRIQVFNGLVIAMKSGGTGATFTVRKVSDGIGVERSSRFYSPVIGKIEVVSGVASTRQAVLPAPARVRRAHRGALRVATCAAPSPNVPRAPTERRGLPSDRRGRRGRTGKPAGPVVAGAVILDSARPVRGCATRSC